MTLGALDLSIVTMTGLGFGMGTFSDHSTLAL
jgi:hypothetical protein